MRAALAVRRFVYGKFEVRGLSFVVIALAFVAVLTARWSVVSFVTGIVAAALLVWDGRLDDEERRPGHLVRIDLDTGHRPRVDGKPVGFVVWTATSGSTEIDVQVDGRRVLSAEVFSDGARVVRVVSGHLA